ncbi:MAG TPA: hypothetical protein VKR99_09930, partial [Candidatus Eremiobacteraceae bacterium]|nr:hypothetical protein [Candidatus Eremiobacteraceae bacterium]
MVTRLEAVKLGASVADRVAAVEGGDAEGIEAGITQSGELGAPRPDQLSFGCAGLFGVIYFLDFGLLRLARMLTTFNWMSPLGAEAVTVWPGLAPTSERPMGDSLEILAFIGSLSALPTIVYSASTLVPRLRTLTVLPKCT